MAKKPAQPPPPADLCFDPNHAGAREIFCAALAGFCAGPEVAGLIRDGSPQAAVEFAVSFADRVVAEFQKRTGGA